jgi:hypothetical protein
MPIGANSRKGQGKSSQGTRAKPPAKSASKLGARGASRTPATPKTKQLAGKNVSSRKKALQTPTATPKKPRARKAAANPATPKDKSAPQPQSSGRRQAKTLPSTPTKPAGAGPAKTAARRATSSNSKLPLGELELEEDQAAQAALTLQQLTLQTPGQQQEEEVDPRLLPPPERVTPTPEKPPSSKSSSRPAGPPGPQPT